MARQASWKGKTPTTTISHTTNTVLDTIYVREGAGYLWAEVSNSADAALDTFTVSISPYSDASFHTIASTASDYTTGIQFPILGCDADLTTLAKSSTGLLCMNIKGVYGVRMTAGTASSDTNLILRWSVR